MEMKCSKRNETDGIFTTLQFKKGKDTQIYLVISIFNNYVFGLCYTNMKAIC